MRLKTWLTLNGEGLLDEFMKLFLYIPSGTLPNSLSGLEIGEVNVVDDKVDDCEVVFEKVFEGIAWFVVDADVEVGTNDSDIVLDAVEPILVDGFEVVCLENRLPEPVTDP